MKRLLIMLTLLFSTTLFCDDELSWVDEQVEAIKPARDGVKSTMLSRLHSPFIFLNRDVKKPTPIAKSSSSSSPIVSKSVQKPKKLLSLAVILNSSAMINDAWYKKGDKVNGYEITEINPKSVLLVKNKKKLLLSTRSIHKNLKFNNR